MRPPGIATRTLLCTDGNDRVCTFRKIPRYATEILRQALVIARAEGVDRVLVTCDDDNAASATIIERSGGKLEDIRPGVDGTPMRRYWIP